MHSRKIYDGSWMIDCTECRFGSNGDGSCGQGWGVRQPGEHGCDRGTLMQPRERAGYLARKEIHQRKTERFIRNGEMIHGQKKGR